MVTKEFVDFYNRKSSNYDPSVFSYFDTQSDYFELNHAVAITGWMIKDNKNFWIIRNSWGREWGDNGYFYIEIGKNLLGIESDCSFPIVGN